MDADAPCARSLARSDPVRGPAATAKLLRTDVIEPLLAETLWCMRVRTSLMIAACLWVAACQTTTTTPQPCRTADCKAPGAVRWSIPLQGNYVLGRDEPRSADLDSGGAWVSVAADDRGIYAFLGNRIVAVDPDSGNTRWDIAIGDALVTEWLRAGRYFLIGVTPFGTGESRHWAVLDPATGAITDSPITAERPRAVYDEHGSVLIRAADGASVEIVDVLTGVVTSSVRIPEGFPVALAGTTLYSSNHAFPPGQETLHRTDITTGERLPATTYRIAVRSPSPELLHVTADGTPLLDLAGTTVALDTGGGVSKDLPVVTGPYPLAASSTGDSDYLFHRGHGLLSASRGDRDSDAGKTDEFHLRYRDAKFGPALGGVAPGDAAIAAPGVVALVACLPENIRRAGETVPATVRVCDAPKLLGINLPTP